jgi:hypothetical protein
VLSVSSERAAAHELGRAETEQTDRRRDDAEPDDRLELAERGDGQVLHEVWLPETVERLARRTAKDDRAQDRQ